ncbi:MAG: thiol oxidoreductase, partial [Bacteroidia bacterium]|nr:thiol oxidoreductase [Bacteroidia bacterium]
MKRVVIYSSFLIIVALSCKKIMPKAPKDEEILDGPITGLTAAEQDQFLKGDIAFNDDIFTPQNGLGPLFVANSCGSCHAGDGKGHPFTTLTRFGQIDNTGNQFIQQGGPQLQNRAIPGYTPELIPSGATASKILPPANTGLGYLDAVSDQDILLMSDPNDANADGISGVPNWVNVPSYCQLRQNAISMSGKYIARFGKKGAAYDLLQQTANAYNQDMGINSSFEPIDTYKKIPVDPEVSDVVVQDVVFYLKTLKAPVQRNA